MKHSLNLLVRTAIRLLSVLPLLCAVLTQTATGGEIALVARDSAAIAAAIQRAANGDVVRLPDGIIEINTSIALKSGVKLIGAGQDKTRIVNDSGHGFRFNGDCRGMAFEECVFGGNGGFGLQIGGRNVDALSFINCAFKDNSQGSAIGLSPGIVADFKGCEFSGNKASEPASAITFPTAAPAADFHAPQSIHAGAAARFECASKAVNGEIIERLWDFNHGIPEISPTPQHTFEKPGIYRVTLIVWDSSGRGARAEKRVEVIP